MTKMTLKVLPEAMDLLRTKEEAEAFQMFLNKFANEIGKLDENSSEEDINDVLLSLGVQTINVIEQDEDIDLYLEENKPVIN